MRGLKKGKYVSTKADLEKEKNCIHKKEEGSFLSFSPQLFDTSMTHDLDLKGLTLHYYDSVIFLSKKYSSSPHLIQSGCMSLKHKMSCFFSCVFQEKRRRGNQKNSNYNAPLFSTLFTLYVYIAYMLSHFTQKVCTYLCTHKNNVIFFVEISVVVCCCCYIFSLSRMEGNLPGYFGCNVMFFLSCLLFLVYFFLK